MSGMVGDACRSQEAADGSASTTKASSRKQKARPPSPTEDTDEERTDDWDDFCDFHHNFFSSGGHASHFDDRTTAEEDWEEMFQQQRETACRRHDRQRQENLRQNCDYRDRRGNRSGEDVVCSCCGSNAAIAEKAAIASGVDWEEHASHPDGHITCWICKDKHISVMTESVAISKFAKKLEPKRDGPCGPCRHSFGHCERMIEPFTTNPKQHFLMDPPEIRCIVGIRIWKTQLWRVVGNQEGRRRKTCLGDVKTTLAPLFLLGHQLQSNKKRKKWLRR